MKTALRTLAAILILSVAAFAQSFSSAYDALGYNWTGTILSGNSSTSGSQSIVVAGATGASGPQTSNGTIVPWSTIFATLTPILVNDGNQEVMTPTSTSIGSCPAGNLGIGSSTTCVTITGTFANTHGQSAPVLDSTAGLQTAINVAQQAGGGIVSIGSAWNRAAGAAVGATGGPASPDAEIYAAVPFANVGISDNRKSSVQFWNVTATTTTALATPTALTGQAACDATHTFCSDASVAGSASWGSTIYCGITYVDIMGQESLTSTTASFTSVASKAIDIGAPAASTGAVGWKPYCSVSGGSYALAYSLPLLTQPTVLLAVPVSAGVCTLTTLETITPACALVNTTYNQVSSSVGAAGLFSKGGAQFTGYPVVTSQLAPNLDSASSQSLNPSNGGHTTYGYVPSNRAGLPGVLSSMMTFPITTAAQSTVGQVAGTIPLPPNFMNYVGRTIEVCGMLSKTSTTADTITNIQLWWDAEGSNVTAGTAVELSNIQITQTLTAAASIPFCQDITTTVAAASATGGTITPGMGWLTEGQVAAGTIHTGATNILFAAVGSLNLALNAKLEVVYNHTTGTDGAGVLLINPTVKILN
jgi:hypothetical protein